MRTQAAWAPFPRGLPKGFKYLNVTEDADEIPSKFILGPDQKTNTLGIEIPHAVIATIARGETKVLVWGWAEYDDIFGAERHRTEFAYWVQAWQMSADTYGLRPRLH